MQAQFLQPNKAPDAAPVVETAAGPRKMIDCLWIDKQLDEKSLYAGAQKIQMESKSPFAGVAFLGKIFRLGKDLDGVIRGGYLWCHRKLQTMST